MYVKKLKINISYILIYNMYVRGCYINVWLVNKIDKNV